MAAFTIWDFEAASNVSGISRLELRPSRLQQ